MEKNTATLLKDKALEVAGIYSNNNYNKETFTIYEIIPLSESTACVVYEKTPGNKKVAFFFIYINDTFWFYYVPTDSHILGMASFGEYKLNLERENYNKNFEGVLK